MKKLLYFLFCCFSITSPAQDAVKTIDSLLFDAQFDQAIKKLDDVLRKTSDQHKRIVLENKKAEALIRAGRFKEAELQLESIAMKPAPAGLHVITQLNKGLLLLNQGRNDLALNTLQEAIANLEKENKQSTLEGALALSYLGNLYLATGKYSQAEEQLKMALAIRENLVKENNELIAASYNDLGLVYSSTDPNKALDHYEKALAIYERIHGKHHPKIAIANTNIGFAYRTLEFYGDAINNFESALTIWEKIYPQAHPSKGFILFNLGQTYLKMGNEKFAEGFYERALATYHSSYGKKHPAIATVLNAMGNIKLSSAQHDEALEYFQQALISNVSDFEGTNSELNPRLKNLYSGNTLLYSLLHKAEALEARHFGKTLKFEDLAFAASTLQLCDTLIDNLRQEINNESDKILLGTIASEVYAAGVRICYEACAVAIRKKNWSELAFYFAEKSKSAVLLESILDSNAKSFAGIPEYLLEEERTLKAELAITAQKLAQKPDATEEKYLRELHYTLNRSYENFIRQLETKFPAYYDLKFNVLTPSMKSLQEKLDESTTILSYFIDEKKGRLYIFQIRKENHKVTSNQLPTDFDRILNGLRNSLTFNELETFKAASANLSALLVPKLPSKIKDLLILPTGRLSIIPFETLFYQKSKKGNNFSSFPYLLKKYSVRYEFSAAMILQKSKKATSATASIFLCAPVTFERDKLSSLPGTESEVKEISELFASRNFKSEVRIREEADEKLIKTTSLKNFSFLHFATHGIVDETSPELSRIYLQSSSHSEDGHLYAGEIYNMELNANLVTLSACQTGLGKIWKGEGVIGLSRALVYAGSKNVMVSFWSVADQSTATLMKLFYQQLLEGSSKDLSTALRQAKLTLITQHRYASPYYWAPFILIGF